MRSLNRLGLAGLLALAVSAAHASTITGSVYSTAPYPAPLNPSTTPTGTDYGSFSVNQINFFGGPLSTSPSYTIGGFLNSNGSVATLSPGLAANAAMNLNNTEFQFLGSNYFATGTYTVTHDDGIYLYLNGMQVISSGSPTAAKNDSFTITTAGNYNFDLLYAEVNGAPATLNFPAAATPEPSSFILLGSGLLSAAGLVRRRLSASR